jgi:GAF domain-containing protein
VGLALLEDKEVVTTVATEEVVRRLEALQFRIGEGPCRDAIRNDESYVTGSLSTDPRWPRFADAATALGYESLLSVPLRARGAPVGSMNLYAKEPDAFDGRVQRLTSQLAEQAGTLLVNAHLHASTRRLVAQLEQALASRSVIEQAKGIVMSRRGCDADEAFALLRERSQKSNRKLRDVAAEIVEASQTLGSTSRA